MDDFFLTWSFMSKTHYIYAGIAACVLCAVLVGSALYMRGSGTTSDMALPTVMAFKKTGPVAIQPHRALYDVTLTSIKSGGQLVGLKGQMYFEWKRTCESWNTDHRSSFVYEYADGTAARVVNDFAAFETLDGKQLDFSSRRSSNGALLEELRGHAKLNQKATYTMPYAKDIVLPKNTFFPMRHTEEVIKRAQKGERFFNAMLFDGSDAEGVQQVNAFIGPRIKASQLQKPKGPHIDASLLKQAAYPVEFAFFSAGPEDHEADYTVSLTALENGVVTEINIIYNTFSIKQTLVALEKIEAPSCVDAPAVAPQEKKKSQVN